MLRFTGRRTTLHCVKTPHAGDRRFAGGDLGRFFDLSTDLLCVVGFDGYFHLLSPSWSRLLGYSDDELTVRVIGAPHVPRGSAWAGRSLVGGDTK